MLTLVLMCCERKHSRAEISFVSCPQPDLLRPFFPDVFWTCCLLHMWKEKLQKNVQTQFSGHFSRVSCSTVIVSKIFIKPSNYIIGHSRCFAWQLSALTYRKNNMVEICCGPCCSQGDPSHVESCVCVCVCVCLNEVVDPLDSGTKSVAEITGFRLSWPAEPQWEDCT